VIGGIGCRLHGGDHVITDLDACPACGQENFDRLAAAPEERDARLLRPELGDSEVRANMLRRIAVRHWRTRAGDIDVLKSPPWRVVAGRSTLARSPQERRRSEWTRPRSASKRGRTPSAQKNTPTARETGRRYLSSAHSRPAKRRKRRPVAPWPATRPPNSHSSRRRPTTPRSLIARWPQRLCQTFRPQRRAHDHEQLAKVR
jgi:hypothetical protein